MKLSIVIACLNDANELRQTILSILTTAGDRAEIVVVDDCSSTPLSCYLDSDPSVVLITNKHRCGCGPSRHIGAMHATGEYILICDSHCRFTTGWYETVIKRIEGRPHTLHCGACLGLDSQNMDINNAKGHYHGGSLTISGPDLNGKAGSWHVLEAIWNPKEPEDDAEIAAPMGACYVMPREYFLKLAPTRLLRLWGCDELFMALKVWRSGGDVRYMKNFRVGHKFLLKNERQGFSTRPGYNVFNKLLAISTLVDEPQMQDALKQRLQASVAPGEWNAGLELFKADYHLVAQELALNRALFKRPLRWVMEKFGLTYQP